MKAGDKTTLGALSNTVLWNFEHTKLSLWDGKSNKKYTNCRTTQIYLLLTYKADRPIYRLFYKANYMYNYYRY